MDRQEFQHLYPDFQLEDELLAEEGRDVMVGIRYTRQQKGGPDPVAIGD
jgi:hypothetical protein